MDYYAMLLGGLIAFLGFCAVSGTAFYFVDKKYNPPNPPKELKIIPRDAHIYKVAHSAVFSSPFNTLAFSMLSEDQKLEVILRTVTYGVEPISNLEAVNILFIINKALISPVERGGY